MTNTFDIVIIGGGPAGATLARLLSPKLKVALIDKKSTNEDSFEKPCGGLLAPDAQKTIAKLCLSLPLNILVDPQIFSVKTIDITENIQRYYQRYYLNCDRHKLDLWLLSLIPSNVTLIQNARCSGISKIPTGYSISYIQNNKKSNISCKYVVGADGANSLVRKNFTNKPIRQYTCIQQSFAVNESSPFYTCFFEKNITDCYGWINIKNGYAQLGVALPKENSRESFEKLRQYFVKQGYPFETPVKIEACLVNRPRSVRELCLGNENSLLIGEAAGFVSPSSLEGISYALESAYILANVFNSSSGNILKRYNKSAKKIKFKIFMKTLKSPFMYYPPLRKIVMKSGFTSISVDNRSQ